MEAAENILDVAGAEETQSQAIGAVAAVLGTAGVRTPSGEVSILEAGDAVYQNDVLVTGDPGGLVIEFRDGSRMDLGRSSEARLDEEVFDPTLAEAPAAEVQAVPDEVEQILLEGGDLSELAPTAAGNDGAGDEGTSFVFLERSDQSTDPESGVDTDVIEAVFGGEPPAEDTVLTATLGNAAPAAGPGSEESPECNLENSERCDLQIPDPVYDT